MALRFAAILILVFSFCHCKNTKEGNTPKNKIGETKMISLLTEIHLVEGAVAPMLLHGDSATQFVINNYAYLFNKYETDSGAFRESMTYYVYHPKEMDKVYEKVIENLSKMQSEIKN